MFGISKLEAYGIVIVVLSLLMAGAYFKGHHSGYIEGRDEVQAQFDAFKNKVEAAGLKAQQDNLDKEKLYATNIATANASRADALRLLSIQQARPRGGFVSGGSANSAPSGKVCYDASALDAALRTLDSGVSRLAAEGDKAMIDGLTLLSAWPQSTPSTSGKSK